MIKAGDRVVRRKEMLNVNGWNKGEEELVVLRYEARANGLVFRSMPYFTWAEENFELVPKREFNDDEWE